MQPLRRMRAAPSASAASVVLGKIDLRMSSTIRGALRPTRSAASQTWWVKSGVRLSTCGLQYGVESVSTARHLRDAAFEHGGVEATRQDEGRAVGIEVVGDAIAAGVDPGAGVVGGIGFVERVLRALLRGAAAQ